MSESSCPLQTWKGGASSTRSDWGVGFHVGAGLGIDLSIRSGVFAELMAANPSRSGSGKCGGEATFCVARDGIMTRYSRLKYQRITFNDCLLKPQVHHYQQRDEACGESCWS